MAELLPALRAPGARPRPLRVLHPKTPEEFRRLEGDFLRLRLGPMESLQLSHEVDVQVDLRSLRDPLETVGLQAHVEPPPAAQGLARHEVDRLTLLPIT